MEEEKEKDKVSYGQYIEDGVTVEREEGELPQKLENVIGDSEMNGNLAAESPGDTSNDVPPYAGQKGSRALGQSDSGELSSTTENIEEPKGAKETGLLTARFATALSGHWDLAEEQFEETAQRVRELVARYRVYPIHLYSKNIRVLCMILSVPYCRRIW